MLKGVNTIAFLAMIIINALSNLIPIGGKTTAQISDSYPNLFTPAGVTFSIWGVIYILLGVFIVYQWGIIGHKMQSGRVVKRLGGLFAVSCIFNILWILCWHNEAIGWSVICIFALLLTLIVIQSTIKPEITGKTEKIAVKLGFDVYLGWIIAAVLANISVWLVKIGWNRFGLSETFWTAVMLLVGAAIGMCVVVVGLNKTAGFTMIWAYAGILTKHLSVDGYSGAFPVIIATAIFGISGILVSILISSTYTSMRVWEETE